MSALEIVKLAWKGSKVQGILSRTSLLQKNNITLSLQNITYSQE